MTARLSTVQGPGVGGSGDRHCTRVPSIPKAARSPAELVSACAVVNILLEGRV